MKRDKTVILIAKHRGFTLAELAIVILIMGIALSMGLKLANSNLENAAYAETKSKQERIKIALIGYLRTNGRVPCPDIAAVPTGIEPVAGCAAPAPGYGVLPWGTLGLAREIALDGWGNFFTYRVSNNNAALAAPALPLVPRANNANQNWTLNSALGFNIASLTSPTAGGFLSLQVDERDSAGAIATVAYNVVAVIYSHGKNGLGARTSDGQVNTAPPAANADEVINNTNGSTRFISKAVTDVAANGGIYDDLIAYITPQDLLQPLVDEKVLTGSTVAFYRDQANRQVWLPPTSCTPPLVGPSLVAIQPRIGNGTGITYTCPPLPPAVPPYSCRTPTAVTSAATLPATRLYQLSMFGAAAQDVTYADVVAAFPEILTRCP